MIKMHCFLQCLWHEWQRDDVPRHAAAIAYYSIFTLPALAIVVITVAGWVVDERTITQELLNRVALYAGRDIADMLLNAKQNLQMQSSHSVLSAAGAVFLLLSSLNVIRHVRMALNGILKSRDDFRGWKHNVAGYVLSVILLLLLVVLLLASVTLDATLEFLEGHIASFIDLPLTAIGVTGTVVTFIILSLLLTLLYRLLPNVRFPVMTIVRSALMTAALMMLSAWLFTTIVTYLPIGRAYGVAATLVVLLLWINVMSMIFLFGAEVLDCIASSNTHKNPSMVDR